MLNYFMHLKYKPSDPQLIGEGIVPEVVADAVHNLQSYSVGGRFEREKGDPPLKRATCDGEYISEQSSGPCDVRRRAIR